MSNAQGSKLTGDQLRRRTIGGPLSPRSDTKRNRDKFFGPENSLNRKSTDPMSTDLRKDPIDKNDKLSDFIDRSSKMKEGDIFLKHSEDEGSTAIAIKEDEIILTIAGGLEGLKIHAGGSVAIQSELKIRNLGFQITKGWFTENPLSFIPSSIWTPIASYLFKVPEEIDFLSGGLIKQLMDFITKFYKG